MSEVLRVIDSHTAGEPTRIIVEGGPDLGSGTVAERLARFRDRFDHIRSAVVNEPRGSDVLVGGMLVPPVDPGCAAGIIFFNNVGFLKMCGHGTIGLVTTLAHLGRMAPGTHRIETCVGTVTVTLHASGEVSVENVASYRARGGVTVDVPDYGQVTGDVAWGGNWFFLVADHRESLRLENCDVLTAVSWKIRQAVNAQGFPEVDHVELFAAGTVAGAHSRNFVLCPGKAYDRSPCGTGTSAKLACLASDEKLAEGETWVQESILGTTFTGRYRLARPDEVPPDVTASRVIIPTITGRAHINADSRLLFDEADPFRYGIR